MPSFFSKLTDKAQAALDQSGLAGKLPMSHTTQAQQPLDTHGNPTHGGGAAASEDLPDGRSSRPFMMESLTHQLKALHQQYVPQGPPEVRHLQVLITNGKGISLDWEGLGRDMKSLSKDFYLWGQDQEEDIKDVTDRLAYLSFVEGSLQSVLSDKLDAAREPLKRLREAQAALSPRQLQRSQIEAQIKKFQTEGAKNPSTEARIGELQDTLKKHIADDAPMERELMDLRRKTIHESEHLKWQAMKEYAEKLLILSQASSLLLSQLPTTAPTTTNPYSGFTATASVRSSLQAALNNYTPGQISLPPVPLPESGTGAGIDTRSFGESHASELSRVDSFSHAAKSTSSGQGALPVAPGGGAGGFAVAGGASPAAKSQPLPQGAAQPQVQQQQPALNAGVQHPHPIDPAALNTTPAPIPHSQPSGYTTSSSVQVDSPASGLESHNSGIPAQPTVAEAGIPLMAGPGGPGPASGSLSRDGAPSYDAAGAGPGGFRSEFTSGEGEKKRLERLERERVLASSAGGPATLPAPAQHESAEDEKKRLEREERERALRGEGPSGGAEGDKAGGPPPYMG